MFLQGNQPPLQRHLHVHSPLILLYSTDILISIGMIACIIRTPMQQT
jgi:hypothetical protein